MLGKFRSLVAELHREESGVLHGSEKIVEHDLIAFPDIKVRYLILFYPDQFSLVTVRKLPFKTCGCIQMHVFHNIQGKVKFLISELDDRERDVLGASVLAWNVKEYSLFK